MHSMEWNVEYTDEFESWWDELLDPVQEDVNAYVNLLIKKGPNCLFRTAAVSTARNMSICANSESKAAASPSEFFMHSILLDQRFFSSVATKLATIASTKK